MLRRALLISAAIFVCGCQGMGQPGASPFGSTRIPPPGTNAYTNPNVTYPTGSNPAGMSGVGAPNISTGTPVLGPGQPTLGPGTSNLGTPGVSNGTGSGSFKSSGLFGTPTPGQFPIPSGTSTSDNTANGNLFASRPNSLFGNSNVTPARFDGTTDPNSSAPVRFGDSRLPPAQSQIRLNGMPANTPNYMTNTPGYPSNNPGNSLPSYVPAYAPGSTGNAANFGWKSKVGTSDTSGTTLR